jgi:hypothetical protein
VLAASLDGESLKDRLMPTCISGRWAKVLRASLADPFGTLSLVQVLDEAKLPGFWPILQDLGHGWRDSE